MGEDGKAEVIKPPSSLRSKVQVGGPGAVDPKTLERAEAVIASLADQYLDWVQEDLRRIEEAYAKLATATGERKAELDGVFQIAHDMKGQGGSFDYHLVTIIGNDMCRFIEKMESVGQPEISVIRLHIDTMKLVIAAQMKGDGGNEGAKLLKGLELVVAKVMR